MRTNREPGPYIVMVSRACMPNCCFDKQNYYRVAIVQTVNGKVPKQINPKHTSTVYDIVDTWERLYRGTSDSCAYAKAIKEATAQALELNQKAGFADVEQL